MRLSTPLAAAAAMLQAAPLVAAEAWTMFKFISYDPFIGNSWSGGLWHTDFGSHDFKFKTEDGCWTSDINVPFIHQVCVDGPNNRAHFIVSGSGQKRCLRLHRPKRVSETVSMQCFNPQGYAHQCFINLWEESDCNW